jgi:hypothetical protein
VTINAINCRPNCYGNNEHLAAGQSQGIRRFPVKTGGYSRVSEYVRDLIREDQKRQTQENLEAILLEADSIGSGA